MIKKPEILFISTKETDIKGLARRFEKQAYKIINCPDKLEYISKNKITKSTVVIIDVQQPCGNIWEMALKVREQAECPIVLLTANITDCEQLLGYELINDFVKKPYDISEVVCRVNILINRQCNFIVNKSEQLLYKDFKIDYSKRKVFINNDEINLTQREFDLFCYLITNKEKVITREEIIQEIWQESFRGDFRTVDTHIKKLRNKIKRYSNKDYIDTVWGVGYRIVV